MVGNGDRRSLVLIDRCRPAPGRRLRAKIRELEIDVMRRSVDPALRFDRRVVDYSPPGFYLSANML